jgi:Protein of unknown function (DUF402)
VTFAPGTSVALREILRGRIWAARPLLVVRDEPELLMFYATVGARWMAPDTTDRVDLIRTKATASSWALVERTWNDTHVLSFAWPGAGHAVLHFWDERWSPLGWYVNVQRPLERFDAGFDTLDEDLDILIEPDRSSWRWKDEEDVALGVELGLYAPADVERFHAEGARGRDRVLGREPPFEVEWAAWRPHPSWGRPALPDGWDSLER